MSLGHKLREFRGDKSQIEVASALGIDNSVLSRIEADDKKRIQPGLLKKIASYYNVSVDELLNDTKPTVTGKFKLTVGSMFSGKTTELLRQGRRYEFAGKRAVFFKPAVDRRYSDAEVVSHDDDKITAYVVNGLSTQIVFTVQDLDPPVDAVLIDEVQLFDDSIINVVGHLLRMGINVYASGLDLDRYGKPFGPVPHLMAIADVVNKLHAICAKCGDDAWISHAKFRDNPYDQVVVGGADLYEPLCRACYVKATR